MNHSLENGAEPPETPVVTRPGPFGGTLRVGNPGNKGNTTRRHERLRDKRVVVQLRSVNELNRRLIEAPQAIEVKDLVAIGFKNADEKSETPVAVQLNVVFVNEHSETVK